MKWTATRHRDVLENGYWKHLHQVRVAWLLERIGAEQQRDGHPLKILDVGCGDGVITNRIKTAFPASAVCAIDLDDVRLRRAVGYCPDVRFCRGDVARLPFRDQSFDVVLCHHVIEHVDDDASLLAECRRLLAPGGLLLLGIPQEDAAIGRWVRVVHRRLYADGEHVHFYSIASMQALLRRVGFTQVAHATFGCLFPFYYVHVLLVWNRVTFALGHWLGRRVEATADSLIFAARL